MDLDIFNDDAFSLTERSIAASAKPRAPQQISDSGLFHSDGVRTTIIKVESKKGQLNLVAPTARGGPGETKQKEGRVERAFMVPHFERDDGIMAEEVQGVRAGAENGEQYLQDVVDLVDERAEEHLEDLDATEEHQKCGAIKGIVYDRDGNEITNLYDAFGIPQPSAFGMSLGTDTTKIRRKCDTLKNKMSDALDGVKYSGMKAYCGRDYWQEFIDHKEVRETYLNQQGASELRKDMGDVFQYGGITWEKYEAGKSARDSAQNGGGFVADDKAILVPTGVRKMFITRYAPADYLDAVNKKGLPRYVKIFKMPNDKGVKIEVQTNTISLNTRPEAVFELVK